MYITEKCNANCPSCFNKDVRGAAEMDLEHFCMLCSYFKLNNVKHIKIMGGEPTMHPNFNTFVTVAQDYFEYVHIFSNGLTKNITSWFPRDTDSIIYNFRFADYLTPEKLMLDKAGKRGLEIQITKDVCINSLFDSIWRVCSFDKDRITAIFTLDCTSNIFKNREIVIDKYVKLWNKCQDVGIKLYQDHKIPICYLYKSTIPLLYKASSVCSIKCSGLIDANYNLVYCNQYPYKLINMFSSNGIIPFEILCNYLKMEHLRHQNIALQKICKDCIFYDANCNGGCFISKDDISRKDILDNTNFPLL